jgi:hypothetical protein
MPQPRHGPRLSGNRALTPEPTILCSSKPFLSFSKIDFRTVATHADSGLQRVLNCTCRAGYIIPNACDRITACQGKKSTQDRYNCQKTSEFSHYQNSIAASGRSTGRACAIFPVSKCNINSTEHATTFRTDPLKKGYLRYPFFRLNCHFTYGIGLILNFAGANNNWPLHPPEILPGRRCFGGIGARLLATGGCATPCKDLDRHDGVLIANSQCSEVRKWLTLTPVMQRPAKRKFDGYCQTSPHRCFLLDLATKLRELFISPSIYSKGARAQIAEPLSPKFFMASRGRHHLRL